MKTFFALVFLILLVIPKTASSGTRKFLGPDQVDVQDSVSLRDLAQDVFVPPERFLFDINWGWVNAGQATLEIMPAHKPNLWKIQSRAWCNSFFQSFYPVHDTIFSIIDSKGVYPVHFEKNLHEGSYEAHIRSWFDQEKNQAWLQDTTCEIKPFTHDILSAFYFIRTKKLVPGEVHSMAAVSGKKKYNLRVFCHRYETVEVPAGKFRTIVVEPKVEKDDLFKAKGKLTIWLTDDEFKLPVKMSSKIPVGSITAELIRAEGKVNLAPPPGK